MLLSLIVNGHEPLPFDSDAVSDLELEPGGEIVLSSFAAANHKRYLKIHNTP